MFSWWVYCLRWPLASRWKRLRLLPSSGLRSCPTRLTRGKSAYANVPVCRPEQGGKRSSTHLKIHSISCHIATRGAGCRGRALHNHHYFWHLCSNHFLNFLSFSFIGDWNPEKATALLNLSFQPFSFHYHRNLVLWLYLNGRLQSIPGRLDVIVSCELYNRTRVILPSSLNTLCTLSLHDWHLIVGFTLFSHISR